MRGTVRSAFPGSAVQLLSLCAFGGAMSACAGAAKSTSAAASAPAPEPVPVASPALTTPAPAEVSAQVRSTRTACAAEAAKQQLDVVDFVTFNRLDDNNWDTTIRARRKGKLVRVGCRYDLRAGWTYVYEPAAADGGNPWGAGGPPKGTGATGPAAPASTSSGAATTPPGSAEKASSSVATAKAPATKSATTPPATKPAATPATPPAPAPKPGAGIVMSSIADTTARSAIMRTREACLAEAGRRKVPVDDFEAFRRVEGQVWEAMLVVKKARTQRSCRLDLATGKATIK